MIQENWDESVQNDVITLLNRMIPSGIWEHDRQDNNGDAHLKAGLVGPSETYLSSRGNPDCQHGRMFFCVNLMVHEAKGKLWVTIISDR